MTISQFKSAYTARQTSWTPFSHIQVLDTWHKWFSALEYCDTHTIQRLYILIQDRQNEPSFLHTLYALFLETLGWPSEEEYIKRFQYIYPAHDLYCTLEKWAEDHNHHDDCLRVLQHARTFFMCKQSHLNLSHLQDIPLPLFFRNAAFSSHVSSLDLSFNTFSLLPESLSSLHKLKRLILQNCVNLTKLPDNLYGLKTICIIDIEGCSFREAPAVLGTLPILTTLFFANAPYLTAWIKTSDFTFPQLRLLDLHGCNTLHQGDFSALRRDCEINLFNTPLQTAFIYHATIHTVQSSNDIYRKLCAGVQRVPIQDLCLDLQNSLVASWLHRLTHHADLHDVRRRYLSHFALDMLEAAQHDSLFRPDFLHIIKTSIRACSNHISFSLLHLEIQQKLTTTPLQDITTIASLLLQGRRTLNLLNQIIFSKIASLSPARSHFVLMDLALTYPICLHEELSIPIRVHPQYLACLQDVTAEDLSNAIVFVRTQLRDSEASARFLLEHPVWIKALYNLYPEYNSTEALYQLTLSFCRRMTI